MEEWSKSCGKSSKSPHNSVLRGAGPFFIITMYFIWSRKAHWEVPARKRGVWHRKRSNLLSSTKRCQCNVVVPKPLQHEQLLISFLALVNWRLIASPSFCNSKKDHLHSNWFLSLNIDFHQWVTAPSVPDIFEMQDYFIMYFYVNFLYHNCWQLALHLAVVDMFVLLFLLLCRFSLLLVPQRRPTISILLLQRAFLKYWMPITSCCTKQ